MRVYLQNTTKKLCVIGDPVLHSKSPLIQNTMLEALGLDYIYMAQPVERGKAAEWLSAAKTAGYAGFNATMPHKLDLVPLMDELDEDARLCQSVNTVCIKEGKGYGYNTDGQGFVQSLADVGLAVSGQRVVLLGAGGAAKAVSLKLAQQGAVSVTVCNRTLERAAELCCLEPQGILRPAGFAPEHLRREAEGCGLLVNCTSLGMGGTGGDFEDLSFLDALPKGAVVCDLIYHPAETGLLAEARRRGHTACNGLGMLIHQAIFALECFTGISIDAALMRPLVEETLSQSLSSGR